MAANKMQFQYEITANTSQAKKALADLDKALDRLNKQQKMDMGLSQELTEAADAARLLQRELSAAMDVKTGKLNVSELARGLAQAGSSVEQLSTKFLNAGAMGEAAFRGLAQSIVAADVPLKKMNKTLSDAMTTLKNTVKWEISSTLVHGLEGAFSGAVSYAKNLNTSLTNIRIVTGQTVDDMVRFTKEANAAAKQLSTTTKAYADASLIYYQQGDSQELAAKKAAITIKAANSSFETSAKEMSEYLTSVWNSYQVGADELERYVDIMANLGAKTATSLEEIATSMQKVAATANTVGVSMEQVSSIIATVSSVTRESAESIGTSYKTIFARIGDLKLGKVDEDGVGLGQVSSQLDAIGVKILDETGNLREMGDIIMDLGTKWQTMNQAQKTAVAQVVAGKRQYTQLMALFENWDMFQNNMNIAENSEGALQNMADIYAESWEAASARVQASMEGIFNKIINDQGIIKVTNTMADLIGGIENVIDGFGGLGGVITSIGSIATAVFKDKITVGVNDVVKKIGDFKKSFSGKSGKDIFTSFFGESTSLREYKKSLNDLQIQLEKQRKTGDLSVFDSDINNATQQVIKAKQQLLDIEQRLTTAEKERYQNSINNFNATINDIDAQKKAYDDQKKSIEQIIKTQTNLEEQQAALQRINPDKKIGSAEVKQKMTEQIRGLTEADISSFNLIQLFPDIDKTEASLESLLQRFKQLQSVFIAGADASKGLKNIEENLNADTLKVQIDKTRQLLQNLSATLKENGADTSFLDELIQSFKKGDMTLEQFESQLEIVKIELGIYANAGRQAEGATTVLTGKLGVAESAVGELADQTEKATSMFRRFIASTSGVGDALNDILSGKGGKGNIGEKFATIAQAATSAVSAFTSWSNITKNWDGMSFTESLGSVAELITDIATSGSISGAIMTAAGAAIGAGLGYIERIQEENLENINRINESINESVEDINTSAQVADQAMKNYKEASEAFDKDAIGQSEYLTIIDSVLEALDAEHLKIFALKEDYVGLRTAIEKANQERLAGDVTKAENLVNTGYYNLIDSLNAYQGSNADSKYGRNGINLSNDGNTKKALQDLGFTLNKTGVYSWGWEGNQTDLAQLQSDWEKIQTDNKYKQFRTTKDFSILNEYMAQFESIFTAMDSLARTSANKVLNELDTSSLTSEKAYESIMSTILTSFGTTADKATSYQIEMAQSIAKDWVANLSTGIQTGFYEGLHHDKTADNAQEYASQWVTKKGHQIIKTSENATLPTFLLTKNEEGRLDNGISEETYQKVEDYKKYVSAYNASLSKGANIENLLSMTGISPEDIGIHLEEDQSISDYLAIASDVTKEALLNNLRVQIDNAIANLGIDNTSYQEEFENILFAQQEEIRQFFVDSAGQVLTSVNALNQLGQGYNIDPSSIYTVFGKLSQDIEGLYKQAWEQLEFDADGKVVQESVDKLMTSTLGLKLDKDILDQMINLNNYDIFDFETAFGYVFSVWEGRLVDAEAWWQQFVTSSKTIVEKTQNDFNQLKQLDADHTKWDEDEKALFDSYANLYSDGTEDWNFKTDAQRSQDVYTVMQGAFNQQWSDKIPADQESLEYQNYIAALQDLNKYAVEATNTSMEDLETNYSYIENIFNNLSSLDLTKPIDETIVSAEKFAEIMGMSIDEFNIQYTSASEKQLALLQAQQKHSQQHADQLAGQVQHWYDSIGKELIDAGDMTALQTYLSLSQQVSQAQADAAKSAQDVKNAYDQINADKIAQITAAAQKQQEEWNKVTNAVSNALSLIKQMSSGDISFSNIEQLKHSLIEAGIETKKVIELIENIENAGNNKEQIKASMVAASQAALAKIGALEEQKQQYKGLITEVDTSQVEPVPMDANATVGEVDDQKLQDTKTDFESNPITPAFSDPTGKEEVVKEVESWGQGKTITYTDAVTGEQITQKIDEVGAGKTLTFTTVDDTTVAEKVVSIGANQILIYTDANGEQAIGIIEDFGDGQSLTFTTANGDTVKATIEGFGDSQKLVYTSVETGETVKTDVQGIGSSQTIKFTSAEIDSGSEVTATISSFGEEQKLIYTTVDGTAVKTKIDSIGSDGTITFTKVGDGGETFTAQITAIGQGQELEFTTINDGSEAFKAALANLGKGQTLEFTTVGTNGEEFIAQVESIGKGQTITFTNANGDTVTQEIAGWTFTNQGLSIDLVSTAESDVKTTISGWTGFTNNNLLIYPSATAESGLQGALNKMKLEAIVDLKFNGMDSLFQTMLSNQSSKLKSSEITQLAEMYSLPFEQALQQVLDTTQNSGWDAFWSSSDLGDAIWGSNNAMATFMTHSVNEIRNMSPEVAATMQNEIAKILDIVTKGMKSDDQPTRELAAFLYEGLASGLSDCTNIDWRSVLLGAELDVQIVDAFCAALKIHSPSELTIALGQYLFDGLKVGIAEADANFTLDPLTGVQNVVSNAFKTAISNALKDGKITDEEFAQLNFSDSLKGHLQNISQMEGTTIQNKIANYERKIGDDAANAYKQLHPEATAEELAAQAQIAIQDFWDSFNTAITESTTEWTEDYFKNKKWNDDSSLSFNQKSIINEALDAVLKESGVNSIEEAAASMENGYSDLLIAIQNKINQMGKTVEFELDDTWAEIKDIWKDGLSSIYGQETQKAEDTYNLWESTFKAIVKARQGLLEGKSVMESLVGDKDALADLYTMYLNQGKTIAEIEALFKDKEAQINYQDWDFENYDKSGKQRFLNRDNNNQYTDTTLTDYNTNVRNYVNDVLAKELADVVGETFNQESLDKIMSSGSEEMKKAIAVLAQQKEFIEETDTGYKVKENISTDSLVQEILDAVAQSLYATDYAQVNSLLGMARATQVDSQNSIADSVRVEVEAVIAEMDTDEQLLLKASGLLREGKTLENNLAPAELEKLKELTGQSDIAAIGLKTLDMASADLTGTMIKAAEQLAIAMGMIQRGEATSAQINPETGKVTVTKDISYADLIANAENYEAYGLTEEQMQGMYDEIQAEMEKRGWQYDKQSGVYSRQDESIKYGSTAQEDITAIAENLKYSKEVELSGEAASLEGTELEDIHLKNLERQQELLKQNAEAVGMTTDEFAKYAQTIEDADTSSNLNNETLYDTARFAKLAEDGWEGLTESQKDNIKTLKKGEKGSKEYKDSLESLTKDVKKVFGDSNKVTEDFVEKHLDEIEKMADGSVEAGEAIEKALLMEDLGDNYTMPINFDVNSDGAIDQLDTLGDFLNSFGDEFADKPIGFTIQADDSQAIQALNDLLASGAMTADQMNSLLATIGWIPEIEEETVEGYGSGSAEVSGKITGTGLAAGAQGTIEGSVDSEQTGTITIPTIKSVTKTGGGASGIKKPSSSGKGGGGSKPQKKEKKDKLRARDEIERYHTNEKVLESIESTLTEIDKLKDRAYGADHVKQLDAETAALKEQLKAQQALKEEAESYIPQDKGEFLKYGAQFDADGLITNYKDVMQAIMDEYNQEIERYNNSAQEDNDKERLEDAKQKYDDLKDSIEKYEEAVQKAKDAANEMLEIQNQLSELEVEKITYQLELKVEMNDRDIELLEYYQSKYEDQITKQDEVFNNFMGTAQEYRNNLDALGNAHDELVAKYNAGLINEADYAEAMADLYDQIVDNLSSLNEIQQELVDTYTNTLELARDEIEKTTNTIESANEALQSYMDIIALTGGETDYQKMASFYEQMNENNIIKIEVQRDHLTALLEEEDRFQEKIAAGQELTDLEKEQYTALREEIEDTKDTLLSSTTEALETIRETYENTINGISKELDEFMSGAAASLEHLQEQYGYFQEEQERYVSTAKELYEVSKLNRDIEGSIGDATSKAAKEALKALQEKINKQSELNELTEYDIEMNQLQYQLLLARIKLEETQNAKDVVRLTRDDDGNYAYRYTANQDKIDEAAQQYEDILQQINDMTVERTAEIEQRLLDTMANYKEKFTAIATDYTLTEEERLMKLEELSSQFAASMQYIQEQNNIATENLAFNQEAIAEHYGTNISAITSSTAGNVNEQIQSMIDKTQEYVAEMNNAIFGEEGQLSAWQKYISQIGDVTGAAGTAYEDMLEDAEEMGEMSGWSAEQAQEVIDALEDTLEPLARLSAAWESHNAILQDTISEYETLAELIQGVLAAVGEIPNTTGLGKADGSSHINKYAKGGIVDYTGLAWVDGTPSDPELMLDAQDTQNILQAATAVKALDSGFIGTLVESVKATAQAMMSMLSGSYHAFSGVHTSNTTLDQNVNITAEFPNVTDHNEIEEALLGLVNRASQFASRKK